MWRWVFDFFSWKKSGCALVVSNELECARGAAMDGPGADGTDDGPQFDFAKRACGRQVYERAMFTALQVN